MHTRAFRLASIALETVERKRQSLDSALRVCYAKAGVRTLEEKRLARTFALAALRRFPEADLLLKREGLSTIPLRRKCAFRVAFALLKDRLLPREELEIAKGGLLTGRLWRLLSPRNLEAVDSIKDSLPYHEKLAVEYSTPPWLVEHLIRMLGKEETVRLLKALWKHTVWLRVNTLKASERKVVEMLKREGLRLRKDHDIPYLYEVVNPPANLSTLSPLREGLALMEDKGSAIVVHALQPQPQALVYDAAAAPGIKTSHIFQLFASEIISADVSRKRLSEMVRLKTKLGYEAHIANADSTRPPLRRAFDCALVDAPCTNSGALGSDPGLRLALWRRPNVRRYSEVQLSMLLSAAKVVRRGGHIVYSTCSLLAEEGEEIVTKAVNTGAFELEEIAWGLPGYPGYSVSSKVRRLYPHVHRTIGFFLARMRVIA